MGGQFPQKPKKKSPKIRKGTHLCEWFTLPFRVNVTLNLPNREKSVRHVVMVAKFLDENKSKKKYLYSEFAVFQTSSTFCNFT